MKTTRILSIAGLALCAAGGLALADTPAAPANTPIAPVPPGAALRAATVRVVVAPDHRDWTYKLGEHALFAVTVTADSEPIDGVTVSYTVGPDMFPGEKKAAAMPLAGMTIDGGAMTAPGFLRCIVTAQVAGHSYRGLATAAFAPEKIAPTQVEPADFDAFWAAGKADLDKVPVDARMTLIPEACTSAVDVYHVSFRTVGPKGPVSARIYGILCEPRAAGRYAAILKVPGAGVRPYSGDPELAAKGALVLEIGIHGIPVNLAKEVYDELGAGALNGYWAYNLDDRDRYYYRRVYLSCVRANDFLASRPNWDGKRLLVMGASQGGQLTLATAALDPRVTGLCATHPAFCDVSAELHGRAGGWPHPFMPGPDGSASPHATPAKITTASYYDIANFARRIRVPGYYNWGYNDEVCPPTAAFAVYNEITAPKTLGVTLELGHSYTVEQYDAISGWITGFLGLK
ncbi:MAG TPA: acetylxylan esterase [Opitutaceae bacterium]|nr:acetylxylan esterase [Opitutaceae bacterium]